MLSLLFFFFNATATTEIYTLSLHDALPICRRLLRRQASTAAQTRGPRAMGKTLRRGFYWRGGIVWRSEEHTSELQSHVNLVCRLLLEKKKKKEKCHHDDYKKQSTTVVLRRV